MSHFNEVANDWDSPGKTKMMKTLANAVLTSLDTSKKYKLMDFGTGTGLFGLELIDIASSLTGIDTSEEMLNVFNKKAENFDNISSFKIDLETESFSENNYDLIISSMAFHHLNHPSEMIKKFKNILNSKGKIIVVDLEKEDGSFHPDNKKMGVKHFGFSKEELQQWANESDISLSRLERIHSIEKNEREYGIFLCEFSISEGNS